MKTALGVVGGLLIGVSVGWGVALTYTAKQEPKSTNTYAFESNAPLLEVDGIKLNLQELPMPLQSALFEKHRELYESNSSMLQQFGLQFALARAKDPNVKVGALPSFDDLLNITKPTDAELQAVFAANKTRLPSNTTFEQIRGEIERFVQNQKLTEVMRKKAQELKASGRLQVLLSEPQPPYVDLKIDQHPSLGPKDAKIVLAEVSDYLCPHCQQMQTEVTQVLKEFEGKLRFVQINFSLKPDSLSGSLMRAAYCARKFGEDEFWKFHDAAFKMAAEKNWKTSDPDDPAAVLALAKGVGLEGPDFETCISSAEAKQSIINNNELMNSVGISGTPTFYLNQRRVLHHVGGLREVISARLAGAGP